MTPPLTADQQMEQLVNSTNTPPPAAAESTAIFEASSPIVLKEFVAVAELKTDVQFNVNDLDTAVMEQAGLFVHYADQARLAKRQSERMKTAFEILESRLYAQHRALLIEKNGKATEAQIEAAVKTDPRWWKGNTLMIDARAIYDLASDAREAFSQRKDMIVQVSVDRRTERQGTMRVMEQKSAHDVLLAAGKAGRAGMNVPAAEVAG